ncbi:MAG TPA: glycerol kinase GlpK, partial [Halanaerobiales bacterium]|nr:glycerol kinase GlpK [Halanaerobiales bacterium]
MKEQYILTIDQSTSGSKVLLVNQQGEIVEKYSREHQQYYPRPGWVEHDPEEIYTNVINLIKEVCKSNKFYPAGLKAIAISNQRETVLVWDKNTGRPVYPAIVWQCNRTEQICEQLNSDDINRRIKNKTGLHLDPYFSASKLKWILDNVDGARKKANKGKLLAGTIDTWLIWKMTDGKIHATDYTNASRTLLFNIKELNWDKDLLELFEIPASVLPEVKPSNAVFGETDINGVLPGKLLITGIIGDSQGALFGQKCFEPGMIKATYGTGTSVLMNTGEKLLLKDKLVTSIAWGIDDKITYVFEGIIRSSGDTLKWTKDNLGLFRDFDRIEDIIKELEDNEGVYLVPAFSGMGIPYWDMTARAAIVGMTKKTDRRHIIRAAVESIAYQVTDAVKMMIGQSGIQPDE